MTPSNEVRNGPDGTVYAARTVRWTSAAGGIPMVIAAGAEAVLPSVVVPLESPFAAPCSEAGAAALEAALEHAASNHAVARSPKPVATWRLRINDLPCRLVSEVRRDGAIAGSRTPWQRRRIGLRPPHVGQHHNSAGVLLTLGSRDEDDAAAARQ